MILTHSYGYALNTETGILTHGRRSGQVKLTGEPIVMSVNIAGYLQIHYHDHIDWMTVYWEDEDTSLTIRENHDETYLGMYTTRAEPTTYNKVGNDLVCDGFTRPDFFLNCKKLLFVTNSGHLPHFVDLDGKIHGHDPKFITKNISENYSFTILWDRKICIFDSLYETCLIDGFGLMYCELYRRLSALDITDIEIYPDVCNIYTGPEMYVLDRFGLRQKNNPNLAAYNTKSAMSK